MASAPFAYRRQPAKALYLAYFALSTLLVRLPYWLLAACVPALRPHPAWPPKRAFMVPLMRATVRALFAGLSSLSTPSLSVICGRSQASCYRHYSVCLLINVLPTVESDRRCLQSCIR